MARLNTALETAAVNPQLHVIISGIGTGGHYFPAIVVAQEMLRRRHRVTFLVRRGFTEESVARSYGLNMFYIAPRQFYGKSILNKMLAAYSFALSISQLGPLMEKSIGFSFGGFGSLPLIIACLLRRRPFFLFEPNSIPGRATRLFSHYSRTIFLGMPVTAHVRGKCLVTGIPIRNEFKTHAGRKNDRRRTILVMGGSGGAKRLNELAIKLQGIISSEYQLVIISGKRDYDWVNAAKSSRTRVIAFTASPWTEIGEADIVVSRSGALAGYEIIALNKKAIFIPFPFAIDDHQYYNAAYFSRIGHATVIDEKNASADVLYRKIEELAAEPARRNSQLILDAEKRIADVIEGSESAGA